MDKGCIVEFGNPYDLLAKGSGDLYDLAKGSKEFDKLIKIALVTKRRLTKNSNNSNKVGSNKSLDGYKGGEVSIIEDKESDQYNKINMEVILQSKDVILKNMESQV